MKSILKNKKGVTILEGLISLSLLALVATGTFAVLLSTSRKSQTPDIREEMSLAVAKARGLLQRHVVSKPADALKYYENDTLDTTTWADTSISGVPFKVCSENGEGEGLAKLTDMDTVDISCLLPPICDRGNSSFSYTVTKDINRAQTIKGKLASTDQNTLDPAALPLYQIKFNITCNGFSYENY